jgi:hypothetical protein
MAQEWRRRRESPVAAPVSVLRAPRQIPTCLPRPNVSSNVLLESAEDEVAALKAQLEEAARARSDLEGRAVDLARRLSEMEATLATERQQARDRHRQLDTELAAERVRREEAEARGRVLEAEIADAVNVLQTQGALEHTTQEVGGGARMIGGTDQPKDGVAVTASSPRKSLLERFMEQQMRRALERGGHRL